MRSVTTAFLLLLLPGCAATGPGVVGEAVREVELAYDDSKPAERPILPSGNFELLVKNEPNIPAYRPVRLRFLVAQPGRIQFQLYENDPKGEPGRMLFRIERVYGPQLTSNGTDGKWVIETLPELPAVKGPLWLGIGIPDSSSEGRVWAASNDSGHVYQRDVEPQTALISSPVHYSPMVRLVIQPQ